MDTTEDTTMTTTQTEAEMTPTEALSVLESLDDGGRLLGGETDELARLRIAREWCWCADEATLRAWIAAGCWDGSRTRSLWGQGVTPGEIAGLRNPDDETQSIGYAHSNGDVSTMGALAAIADAAE